jgi:hypothetical protein
MASVLVGGRNVGYLCWAVSGILGLLILPDKGIPLLYLLFLGLYPVVKSKIESMRKLPLEWLCKLAFFNVVLTIVWFFFQKLFVPVLPRQLRDSTLLIYGVGNLVFVLYDIGLSRLIALLRTRLRSGGWH